MDISFEVVHAVPGRTRIRVPELKDAPDLGDCIADTLLAKPGVNYVRVNPACASVVVGHDKAQVRTFVPESCLRGVRFQQVEGRIEISVGRNGRRSGVPAKLKALLRRFAGLVLPTVTLALTFGRHLLPIAPMYGLVAAAAAPIFRRAALTVRREKRLGVDFLDATAVAIMGFQRNLPTCALMAWLISIGEHIREETARKSQKAIADLLEFDSGLATVLRGRRRVKVPVALLKPGDRVVVNAGDVVPVDGVVTAGRAGIDQRSLTGESAMIEHSTGDRVFAGSIAVDGRLTIEAQAVGLDTRTGKIVQMLRSAPHQDTKIEDYAARFADRLVAPTMAVSGAVYACSGSLARALSMLIVDFGTGVRVAAPTAFLSSMTYAATRNIVIKGGRAMEKLAAVDTVILDKTGTLTTGLPEVRDVIAIGAGFSEELILRLAAAAEEGLNHPVANALAARAGQRDTTWPERVETRLRVGLGVKAQVDGRNVLVGSERLMDEELVDLGPAREFAWLWERDARSPLYIAVDGALAGLVTCADCIRPESAEVIDCLRKLGIGEIIMVTGDREEVARAASRKLGIECCRSEAFPEQKLGILRDLQREGRTVAVVGDGVNDSLALAHADVAVAPACATDAAKEAADVLLMDDDLRLLVEAFSIAKSAVQLVKQNYSIVAVPNAAALALAASGLLGPPGATLINNGSTVAAGLNGLRPLLSGRNGAGRRGR